MTSAWLQKYRQPSFRGVPFQVSSHDFSTGRRGTTHEYPFRDIPYTEDTGRKAQSFSIEAYVVGDNYVARRDRLIRACEKPGKGQLIHPYLGAKDVICTGFTVRESDSEGRMARFQISFVEAGQAAFPSAESSGLFAILDKADKIMAQADSIFEEGFSIANTPQNVLDSAATYVGTALDMFEQLSSTEGSVGVGLTTFFRELRSVRANLGSLLFTPEILGNKIGGLMLLLVGTGTSGPGQYRLARKASTFGLSTPVPPKTTPNRVREAENQQAIARHVQTVGTSLASKSAIRIAEDAATIAQGQPIRNDDGTINNNATVFSFEDIKTIRSEMIESIDAQLENIGSDVLFDELSALKALLVKHVPSQTAMLPRQRIVTPVVTMPSLVLAYQFYNDPRREADLIARNGIGHPAFIRGGEPLEVVGGA